MVAGVLSGTSADGIDVALARVGGRRGDEPALEPLAFEVRPFEAQLAGRVRALLDGRAAGDARALALLDRDLGRAFGRAARALAHSRGLPLALVASHGQTVWHHDGDPECGPATLQLGDGCFVAAEAGAPCASDFRQADLAAGGEGAPITALADGLLFADEPRPLCVLNLGGISNLTWIEREHGAEDGRGDAPPLAFDVGPANALLDGLARRVLGAELDRDGRAARAGRVDERVLAAWAAHPFLERAPPKSTGRDTFGEQWLAARLEEARRLGVERAEDLLACGTELVALAVARALERFLPGRPRRLLAAGGGAHNPALLAALERRCALPVPPSSVAGVDPRAREALAFCVLGLRRALGSASDCSRATGAGGRVVLGKLSEPPRALPRT